MTTEKHQDPALTSSETTIRGARAYATENERNRVLGILAAAKFKVPDPVLAAIREGTTVAAFSHALSGPRAGEQGVGVARARGKSAWADVTAKLNTRRRETDEKSTPNKGAT